MKNNFIKLEDCLPPPMPNTDNEYSDYVVVASLGHTKKELQISNFSLYLEYKTGIWYDYMHRV